MSDREKAGLRGPVRTCLEETIFPGTTTRDGTQIPERKSWYTTEYDVDGRVKVARSRNSDGSEWATRYAYDASGHLLKTAWSKEDEPSQETNYSYDGHGRQLHIIDSRTPDNPITFRYDERGRKTKVRVFRSAEYRPNAFVAGSPFEVADMAPNLPGGGSATTIYDEDDHPTEIQIRDTQGKLVSRAVRIYDAQGRINEEKQILDNPETMFPPETLEKFLEASGASREELREQLRGQLTKLMGGQVGPFSAVYSYDAQGRVNQMRRQIFNQEDMIETTYNEHGDKAAEITRGIQIVSEEEKGTPGSGPPPYSEVRFSYRYDSHGNWTEEDVSYLSSPGGAVEPSTGRRRTLTYY
jgi:YD repeat-containing protein